VRLWSIQSERVWKTLTAKGRYRVYRNYIDKKWWKDFGVAYEWMVAQMTKRIGPPPDKRLLPVWAWRYWRGNDNYSARPDLRTYRDLVGRHVRIEFEVPDEQVLLSGFEAWHSVLNQWFHSWNEKEWDAFYAKVAKRPKRPLPKTLNKAIRKSWDRIFDLESGDPEWRGKPEERAIQACVWEIRLDDVTDAMHFTGKGKSDG
jgi:hypothetical protein